MPAEQRFPAETIPKGYLLALVLAVSTALFSLLPSGFNWDVNYAEVNLSEGSLAMKLQWGSLFLIAALICLVHHQRMWAIVAEMNPFLRLILLYCTLSMLWSPFPVVTIKKSIQLVGMVLIASAFQVTQFSMQQFVRVLLNTFLAIQLVSLIVIAIYPDTGIEYAVVGGAWTGGAWRGILAQKNEFGMLCALAVLFQVVLIFSPEVKTRPALVVMSLVLSVVGLLMSKSTTSFLVMSMGLCSYFLFKYKWIQTPFVMTRVMLCLLSLALLGVHIFHVLHAGFPSWDDFFGSTASLLGKQTDLSGRFDIWQLLLPEIAKHWLLGFGYGAFWLGIDGPSQYIIDQLGWVPYQAHNGYLDILNEQGVVGFALFVFFLGRHIRNLYELSRDNASQAAFHGALLLIILVSSLSESSIFRSVNFFTIMLIYSSVAVTSVLARLHTAAPQDQEHI